MNSALALLFTFFAASNVQAEPVGPTALTDRDIVEVTNEVSYASQHLIQLKARWDDFSSDIRRPIPVYTSTQRANNLRELVDGYWVESDSSLRKLQNDLRPKTSFPVGARVKLLANIDDVRRLVLSTVGDDETTRINSYMVRLRDSLRNNSGSLVAGYGELTGSERTAWEERYLDPIDSYLFYAIDSLSKVKLATATWPDVVVSSRIGNRLSQMVESGIYHTPESAGFCKIEIKKLSGNSNDDWLHVRVVSDSTTPACMVGSGSWQILNCQNRNPKGFCEGILHGSQNIICRLYHPALQQAEFELFCANWDRGFTFVKL